MKTNRAGVKDAWTVARWAYTPQITWSPSNYGGAKQEDNWQRNLRLDCPIILHIDRDRRATLASYNRLVRLHLKHKFSIKKTVYTQNICIQTGVYGRFQKYRTYGNSRLHTYISVNIPPFRQVQGYVFAFLCTRVQYEVCADDMTFV